MHTIIIILNVFRFKEEETDEEEEETDEEEEEEVTDEEEDGKKLNINYNHFCYEYYNIGYICT